MAVIALCSASGSPGVTTTAVGLALSWTRPSVLVEADPTGGSPILAGYLRAQVSPPDAMTELSIAQQQGRLRDEIPQVVLPLPDSQVSLLPGVRSHVQGSSLIGLWDELLAALKGLDSTGQDAIVDLGRLGLAGAATPVLYGADLTLVVCRSDVVSLSGARSWLATLRAEFEEFGAGTSLGLLLVGPGQPYSAKEVSSVVGVPVVATIAWDPKTAPVFRDGERVRKFESSKLVRSLRAAQESMAAVVKANEDALNDMRGETR